MYIRFTRHCDNSLRIECDTAEQVKRWARGHNVPVRHTSLTTEACSGNVTLYAYTDGLNWFDPLGNQGEALKGFARGMSIKQRLSSVVESRLDADPWGRPSIQVFPDSSPDTTWTMLKVLNEGTYSIKEGSDYKAILLLTESGVEIVWFIKW